MWGGGWALNYRLNALKCLTSHSTYYHPERVLCLLGTCRLLPQRFLSRLPLPLCFGASLFLAGVDNLASFEGRMAFSLHKRLGPTSYFGLAPPDHRGPRDDS